MLASASQPHTQQRLKGRRPRVTQLGAAKPPTGQRGRGELGGAGEPRVLRPPGVHWNIT